MHTKIQPYLTLIAAFSGIMILGAGLLFFFQKDPSFPSVSFGLVLICVICGLVFAGVFEAVRHGAQCATILEKTVRHGLEEAVRHGAQCATILEATRQDLQKVHRLMNVYDVVRRSKAPPFVAITNHQLDAIDRRLQDLANNIVYLKREEIVECWEYLIGSCVTTVDATNIVSSSDWRQFSSSSGIDVHKKALNKGVTLRRILIYDEKDISHKTSVTDLEGAMRNLGIGLRKLSREDAMLEKLVREFETVDLVIFDKGAVLFTFIDDQKRMRHAKVLADPQIVHRAMELYDKLWNTDSGITS